MQAPKLKGAEGKHCANPMFEFSTFGRPKFGFLNFEYQYMVVFHKNPAIRGYSKKASTIGGYLVADKIIQQPC